MTQASRLHCFAHQIENFNEPYFTLFWDVFQ